MTTIRVSMTETTTHAMEVSLADLASYFDCSQEQALALVQGDGIDSDPDVADVDGSLLDDILDNSHFEGAEERSWGAKVVTDPAPRLKKPTRA